MSRTAQRSRQQFSSLPILYPAAAVGLCSKGSELGNLKIQTLNWGKGKTATGDACVRGIHTARGTGEGPADVRVGQRSLRADCGGVAKKRMHSPG